MDDQIVHYENKIKYEMDLWGLHEGLSTNENIVVIDTRSFEAYEVEHLPSSLNMSHRTMLEKSTRHLDKATI